MLKPGIKNMRANYKELMTNIESPARRKAIETLAAKHNITFEEAQARQARRIVESQAHKK